MDSVSNTSVFDLLEAAARGLVGVDRRFVQSILDRGEAVAPELLRFSRAPQDSYRIDLDPLLVDLFRHFQTPAPTAASDAPLTATSNPDVTSPAVPTSDVPTSDVALDFYIDAIRRAPDDVDDGLIQALLPFGDKAAGPLLALYEELDEEDGADIAFLLAALRVRDPRVLQLLLERLEYDAADGAFCLGLLGDPASRPALEKMLGEVSKEDVELRREIQYALEQLDAPEPRYQPEPFDILAEYPEHLLPPFDVLTEDERLEMLTGSEADVRKGAAHSFFNRELSAKSRTALIHLTQDDPDPGVRGEAWAALSDATETDAIRDAMVAVLIDESKTVEERGGAAVGLYAVADRDDARKGIEALYELGGKARVRALEAMWRSLWQPYAKYFPANLTETDPEILKHALRGAGYFRLTAHIDKIASFFDREEPLDELRDDALFAYALAMPGETTRGRARGMLRKIVALVKLSVDEVELVMFALDERLRLHGLEPVFEAEMHADHDHSEHDHTGHDHDDHDEHEHGVPSTPRVNGLASPGLASTVSSEKLGRNDPCPCGSGKKYKKCHGA